MYLVVELIYSAPRYKYIRSVGFEKSNVARSSSLEMQRYKTA